MEYMTLGKTGRRVSRIGFGGATAGIAGYLNDYDPTRDEERQRVVEAIRRAYALGVNYFDTAPAYGKGISEEIFGEALQGIPEEEIFLATKVKVGDGAFARDSLEQSLRRLRRDRVDLIQLHGTVYSREDCQQVLAKGGELEALEKARDEGLVRHIGFTVECQNEAVPLFIRSGRFEVMQVEYSLIFQHPYDPGWKCGSIYDAEEQGMGIATMRTLTSGIFQKWIRRVNPNDDFDYNASLLQFVLSNPLVDVALLGMRSAKRVEANVATCEDLGGRLDIGELHDWF